MLAIGHALDVLNNWRSSHSFPLNTLQMALRQRSASVCEAPIVAQRLKRVPSIIQKLRRISRMNFARMQDIGGARAVLPTIAHVDSLREVYRGSRTRHELAQERDYVRHPKNSGYRSIHLVYRYHSDRNDRYNGLQIELQLRTRLQHAWATAVETVGTTEAYLTQEKNLANTAGDTVLVSSDSLESLRRAFPNYFLDTRAFVEEMDRLLA